MSKRPLTTRFTLGTHEPCEKCPYRCDAPVGLWSPQEFERLLASDLDPDGVIYGCHKRNGDLCAGWLLDQRERGVPSVALRSRLAVDPELASGLRDVHDGGHELYDSVEAMCEANGVTAPTELERRYAGLLERLALAPGFTPDALVVLGDFRALRPWRRCVARLTAPWVDARDDVHAWFVNPVERWPYCDPDACERCALLAVVPDGEGNPVLVVEDRPRFVRVSVA